MSRDGMARGVQDQPVLIPAAIGDAEIFTCGPQELIEREEDPAVLGENICPGGWLSLVEKSDKRTCQRDLLVMIRLGLIDQDLSPFPRNVHPFERHDLAVSGSGGHRKLEDLRAADSAFVGVWTIRRQAVEFIHWTAQVRDNLPVFLV